MRIKEFRITMPVTAEENEVGQAFTLAKWMTKDKVVEGTLGHF